MPKPTLNPKTKIEVQMRKVMTYEAYLKLMQSNLKGWSCQAYQIGILKPMKL